MSDQTGLYQDGNSVFENVFIQGKLNVATANEKLVVDSDGISIDTITTNSDGKTIFSGDLQLNDADSIIHTGADTSRLRLFGGSSNSVNNGAALTLQGISESGGNYADLASGTGGFVRFRTGTDERLRINSDGRVGINSLTPAATLDIRDVGSTGPGILISGCNSTEGDLTVQDGEILHVGHFNSDTNTYTDRFRIESTGVKEIRNGNLELNSTYIDFFGNYNSGLTGQTAPPSTHAAIYRPQDNTLCFSTASSERLRIGSGGDVDITEGHLSLNLGHGIDFSDTANSTGTTSSEIFDDYEEGSFTPAYQTSNNNIGTVTYDNAFTTSGRYIKIGRLVYFTLRMKTDNISSVGTGNIDIVGLPFTHVNAVHQRAVTHNIYSAAWRADDAPSLALIQNNTTRLRLYQKDFNEDSINMPVGNFDTGSNHNDVRITGMYEASS